MAWEWPDPVGAVSDAYGNAVTSTSEAYQGAVGAAGDTLETVEASAADATAEVADAVRKGVWALTAAEIAGVALVGIVVMTAWFGPDLAAARGRRR